MATISVSDIRPAGSDLFLDDKYMNDLSEDELNLGGGITFIEIGLILIGTGIAIAGVFTGAKAASGGGGGSVGISENSLMMK